MFRLSLLSISLMSAILVNSFTSPEDIATQYSLTVSTTIPFPTATLSPSDAASFLVNSWSLRTSRLQNRTQDLAFVSDPLPSSFAAPSITFQPGPVLQVTYPKGSFGENGAQFTSLFNGSISPQSMLLSYEVAFDSAFQFVKGGKLPGLRGGPDANGCEGGSQPNGTDCWSARLMWRKQGAGEVYAYISTPNHLCDSSDIICNPDFGTSIGRNNFDFLPGAWNRITLFVQLNSQGNLANGNIWLYYNDVQAIFQPNLQLRSDTNVLADGLFFSTFFGGSDDTWASPVEQHTYFRNFRMWASAAPSNSTGVPVSSASSLPQFYYHIYFVIFMVTLMLNHSLL